MKLKPLVSVNIRTYNSEKTLRDTLESIKKQSYKNIEILISDGYSKDNSVTVAREFGAKVNFADKLGDARYQNYINSKGKYVFSVDSDQVLDNDLIETCVYECEANKNNVLIIAEKSLLRNGTFLEKLLKYDKWLIDKTQDADVVFGTACPRFFKKDLLEDIAWPKELSIFDDTVLYSQLSSKDAKIKYVSNQFLKHYEATSWLTFAKKFYRYGKGYIAALKVEPKTIAAHSLPRRAYFTKFAISKPHYFLGLMLLYTIKASMASLGAISALVEGNLLPKKPTK